MASNVRLTYDINEARRRIYVRVRGLQNGTELLQAMSKLVAEVDGFLTYDRILDLRDSAGFADFDEVAQRVKAAPQIEGPRGRTAIVSSNPFTKAHITGLSDLLSPDSYRAFATLDEAIDWLDTPRVD